MKLSYDVTENSIMYEAAWGCFAQCCIRSETGSKGWYMLS